MISQILYTIFWSALFIYVTGIAFSFFGIGFEIYGNYMLWLVALILFWSILPTEATGNIFNRAGL
jgi:hypothetical protein